ncbi:MAG: enoyl-CoA hydratase-related protein [Pseudomonadota bacterium]
MIKYVFDDRTGRADIILDRPEKLNALTVTMWRELASYFRDVSDNEAVRVVVLSGSGRAFCVGADIAEFETTRAGKAQALNYAETIYSAVTAIEQCPHPVMAAIRGHCVGGGVEIAASCDIRIAAEESQFGVPIKRLGLTVDYPELMALCRLVGPSTTLEILFEGRIFDADEALAKGLINRIVKLDGFEAEIDATAKRIAEGAPLVARWHKRMIRKIEGELDISDNDRRAPFNVFDSEDYRIGTQAFINKTAPVFLGR